MITNNNYINKPFLSSKKSHFQNEAKCETFVVKMTFICITIKKKKFHINGFALSLAFEARFFGTRKWPIQFPYDGAFVVVFFRTMCNKQILDIRFL